jgi:hypothetical protein
MKDSAFVNSAFLSSHVPKQVAFDHGKSKVITNTFITRSGPYIA